MESHLQTRGHQAAPTPRAQRKPRSPQPQNVPPPEEENPRMKCRDCGAFGHTIRSRRCPIKYHYVFQVPWSLGSRKEKENQDPCMPQDVQKPGPISQDERDKKRSPGVCPGQACDEQRQQKQKAPFQKLPVGLQRRDQHINLAPPQMPVFILGIRKRPGADGIQTTVPPAKKSLGRQRSPEDPVIQSFEVSCILPSRQEEDQNKAIPGVAELVFRLDDRNTASLDQKLHGISHQHPVAVPKRNGIGEVFHIESKAQGPSGKMTQPSQHPAFHQDIQNPKGRFWAPYKKASLYPTQPSQNFPKKPRVNSPKVPEESNAKTVPKASLDSQSSPIANRLKPKVEAEMSKEIAAQIPSTDQHHLHGRTALVLTRPCIETHQPSAGHGAGQALRMIFTRHNSNCWSSRFMTVSPALPTEKQTPPSKSPGFLEKVEKASSQVPVSILYEDLQVSSSSEDSNGK